MTESRVPRSWDVGSEEPPQDVTAVWHSWAGRAERHPAGGWLFVVDPQGKPYEPENHGWAWEECPLWPRTEVLPAPVSSVEEPQETTKIFAPWSSEIALTLIDFQQLGYLHPFTCPREHAGQMSLVANNGGWFCPADECDYTQNWAWAYMADRSVWPSSPIPAPSSPVSTPQPPSVVSSDTGNDSEAEVQLAELLDRAECEFLASDKPCDSMAAFRLDRRTAFVHAILGEGWRPPLPTPDVSPWDAYVKAHRGYQQQNPAWKAYYTAHHMHALDAALRVYDPCAEHGDLLQRYVEASLEFDYATEGRDDDAEENEVAIGNIVEMHRLLNLRAERLAEAHEQRRAAGEWSIDGEWLVGPSGRCNCDGPFEVAGTPDHRDGCGIEPLMKLSELPGLLASSPLPDSETKLRDETVGAWCELEEDERDEITEIAPRLGQLFERLTCDVNREWVHREVGPWVPVSEEANRG